MTYVDSPSIEELTKLKNRINAFGWTMESQLPVPNN